MGKNRQLVIVFAAVGLGLCIASVLLFRLVRDIVDAPAAPVAVQGDKPGSEFHSGHPEPLVQDNDPNLDSSPVPPAIAIEDSTGPEPDSLENLKTALADSSLSTERRNDLLKRVVEAGDKYVPGLIETLRTGSEEQRECSAAALAMIGTSDSVAPLIDAIRQSRDPRMRENLRSTLDLISGTEANPVLLTLLGEGANRDLVEAAKTALARNADAATVQDLATAIDNESGKETPNRTAISDRVQTFMKIDNKSLTAPLSSFLAGEHSTGTVLGSASALANIGSAEAMAVFVDSAGVATGNTREILLTVLGNIKPVKTEGFPVLQKALLSSPHEDLRISAARAVSAYPRQLAQPVLEQALETETSEKVKSVINKEKAKVSGNAPTNVPPD